MATNTVWPKIDGEHVQQSLQEIIEKLDSAENEVVLESFDIRAPDESERAAGTGKAGEQSG